MGGYDTDYATKPDEDVKNREWITKNTFSLLMMTR
jgi:hypothetical protein